MKSVERITTILCNAGFKLFLALLMTFLPLDVPVYSLPQGESVTDGSAAFDRSVPDTLNITTSDKVAINWQNFDVGRPETVNYIQPSSSSVALNRIYSGSATQILGTINANGQIFILNPSGVIFGKGSSVNVGGLFATTLDISDDNFRRGLYKFENTSGKTGIIANYGEIIADNGYAAFASDAIINEGLIRANMGKVVLASADKVTLSFDPNSMISVAIDAPVSAKAGLPDDAITNTGSIQADSGEVFITQSAAREVFRNALNSTGTIRANTITEENGIIKIISDDAVKVGGVIEAKGAPEHQRAGEIEIRSLAEDVLLDNGSMLDISGDFGKITLCALGDMRMAGSLGTTPFSPENRGTIYIDPADLIIDTDVTSAANLFYTADDNIEVRANITTTGGANIDFLADFDGGGFGSFGLYPGYVITSDGYIHIDTAGDPATSGANLIGTMTAQQEIEITANHGANDAIYVYGDLTSANSHVYLYANGNIDIDNAYSGGGNIQALDPVNGDVSIIADYKDYIITTLPQAHTGAITINGLPDFKAGHSYLFHTSGSFNASKFLDRISNPAPVYTFQSAGGSITIDRDLTAAEKITFIADTGLVLNNDLAAPAIELIADYDTYYAYQYMSDPNRFSRYVPAGSFVRAPDADIAAAYLKIVTTDNSAQGILLSSLLPAAHVSYSELYLGNLGTGSVTADYDLNLSGLTLGSKNNINLSNNITITDGLKGLSLLADYDLDGQGSIVKAPAATISLPAAPAELYLALISASDITLSDFGITVPNRILKNSQFVTTGPASDIYIDNPVQVKGRTYFRSARDINVLGNITRNSGGWVDLMADNNLDGVGVINRAGVNIDGIAGIQQAADIYLSDFFTSPGYIVPGTTGIFRATGGHSLYVDKQIGPATDTESFTVRLQADGDVNISQPVYQWGSLFDELAVQADMDENGTGSIVSGFGLISYDNAGMFQTSGDISTSTITSYISHYGTGSFSLRSTSGSVTVNNTPAPSMIIRAHDNISVDAFISRPAVMALDLTADKGNIDINNSVIATSLGLNAPSGTVTVNSPAGAFGPLDIYINASQATGPGGGPLQIWPLWSDTAAVSANITGGNAFNLEVFGNLGFSGQIAGAINASAQGNIYLGSLVSKGGTLNATAGSIIDNNGDAINWASQDANATANASGTVGTSADALEIDIKHAAFNASAGSSDAGGVSINLKGSVTDINGQPQLPNMTGPGAKLYEYVREGNPDLGNKLSPLPDLAKNKPQSPSVPPERPIENESAFTTKTNVECLEGAVCIQSVDASGKPTGEELCIKGGEGASVTLGSAPIYFELSLIFDK